MIEQQYQRKGYGSQAMALVLEHGRGLPHASEVRLSYRPAEGKPLPFCQKSGSGETGERDGDEKVMAMRLKENR